MEDNNSPAGAAPIAPVLPSVTATWSVVEHSWAETSVMEGGRRVCLLSIEDEATEETQDELEKRTARRARLIAAAPDLLEALTDLKEAAAAMARVIAATGATKNLALEFTRCGIKHGFGAKAAAAIAKTGGTPP